MAGSPEVSGNREFELTKGGLGRFAADVSIRARGNRNQRVANVSRKVYRLREKLDQLVKKLDLSGVLQKSGKDIHAWQREIIFKFFKSNDELVKLLAVCSGFADKNSEEFLAIESELLNTERDILTRLREFGPKAITTNEEGALKGLEQYLINRTQELNELCDKHKPVIINI